MARIADSLAGRLGLTALVTHAVLLPLLYLALDSYVTRSEQEAHVTEIRTYARLVADQIEFGGAAYSDEQIRALLEHIVISGDATYAEFVTRDNTIRAAFGPDEATQRFPGDDFDFGKGGDHTYNLSIVMHHGGVQATLRIGFDETFVMEKIQRTRRLIAGSLGAFFLVSTLLATYFGMRLARPLEELQRTSRRVASGELALTLSTDSRIEEVRQLTADLEVMRERLVNVGQRLQQEMQERDLAERQRRRLEDRLAQRRRLETVGTLAGGIAHEFNNILVPIQLYTELAVEDLPEDSPTRADLIRVLEAARRAKRIVSDILVFTREPQPGARAEIDTAVVLGDVGALYQRIAHPGIRVVVDVPSDCPHAAGDPGMLHQVVHNLCSNACAAMLEAGGTLTLSAGAATAAALALADLPAGRYVAISVRDTGHGIDEAVRQRIFEPFFTTRGVGHGTGLGLFVVHGMVSSMGGAVTVESEPGTGTEFHVLLPEFQHEAAEMPPVADTEVTT